MREPFLHERPVAVISGSNLAMLANFIANADGVRPVASAYLIISKAPVMQLPKSQASIQIKRN